MSGCTTGPSIETKRNAIMNSWIGSHKSELIAKVGPPDTEASNNSTGEILTYDRYIDLSSTTGLILTDYAGMASYTPSKERKAFGKEIAKFQAIQFKLSDMAVKVDAAKLLTLKASALKDAGKKYFAEAAMAKLYSSKISVECALEAIQIHGGYGYVREYLVERYLRDAKITEIYEGTSEIQKIVIARSLLDKK